MSHLYNIHAFELTGYRDEINSLRQQANRLGEQTELLAQAVDELEAEASLMQNLEEQLSEIAHEQGVTVNEILLLVRENEHVLSQQKANLKVSKIFQIIFSFT
jgi:prefoldin subunit 5